MLIIGVSGKKGSGKDTLANILVKKYGFIKRSFAEALKSGVRKDFDLTKDHTDGKLKELPTKFINTKYHQSDGCLKTEYWTPRDIMVEYGQFFRKFNPNYWVDSVFDNLKHIDPFKNYPKLIRVVISDVRFKNEADRIREEGGYVARLDRKLELNIYKTISDDVSETDLDNYTPDFLLSEHQNINPNDLEKFADYFMRNITDEKIS